MESHYTLPATLKAVSQFTHGLETHFQNLELPTRTAVVLAIHELLVNIVQHAYAGAEGQIDLTLMRTNMAMIITINDTAENAFVKPDVVNAPGPQSLPEHGLGLCIVYGAFDTVRYERLARGNRWHLTLTIGGYS